MRALDTARTAAARRESCGNGELIRWWGQMRAFASPKLGCSITSNWLSLWKAKTAPEKVSPRTLRREGEETGCVQRVDVGLCVCAVMRPYKPARGAAVHLVILTLEPIFGGVAAIAKPV